MRQGPGVDGCHNRLAMGSMGKTVAQGTSIGLARTGLVRLTPNYTDPHISSVPLLYPGAGHCEQCPYSSSMGEWVELGVELALSRLDFPCGCKLLAGGKAHSGSR